jgi:hypothetical protein
MRISNAKDIIIRHNEEWARMMNEEHSERSLLLYGIAMITISNIVWIAIRLSLPIKYISLSWIGMYAGIQFVFSLASLLFIPILFAMLAPRFDGIKDSLGALKLYLFFATPVWMAGVISPIPYLGWLSYAGVLFGLYLVWKHVAEALNISEDKKHFYFINICFLLISVLAVRSIVARVIAYKVAPFTYPIHKR